MRKILATILFLGACSLVWAQKTLVDYSLSELDQAKKKAAMNEDYAGAAKFKKAYELRVALDQAVQNEEYAKAADLKKQIQALEGGAAAAAASTSPKGESYSSSSGTGSSTYNGSFPTVDYTNTVMLWDKASNTAKNLEYGQPEMVTKAGGFAFYASATSFWKLSGSSSSVKVKEGDSFIVRVSPGMNPQELFKLVNFDLIGDGYKERYLPTFTSSTAAVPFSASTNTTQNTKNYRDIEYVKLSDEYYEILVKGVLLSGEYAFYGLNKMYAFSSEQMFTNSGAELPKTAYSLADIYTIPVVYWYGVDFSLLQYINPRLQDHDASSLSFISTWSAQVKKDLNMGRFQAWLRKSHLNDESNLVSEYYRAVLEEGDWIGSNEQVLSIEKMQEQIELYPPSGSGLGLAYMPENINQQSGRMSGYFVWFDRETKAIVDTQRVEGRGSSEENWGKYFEELFTNYIDYDYKKEWKKYQ